MMTILCLICTAGAIALFFGADPWDKANQKAQADAALVADLSTQPDRIGWRLTEDLSLKRAMLWDKGAGLLYPLPNGFTPILYQFSEDETRRVTALQSTASAPFWEPFDTIGDQLLHCRVTPAVCLVYDRAVLEEVLDLGAGTLKAQRGSAPMSLLLLVLAAVSGGVAIWAARDAAPAPNTFELKPERHSAARGALEVQLSPRDLKLLMFLQEKSGAVATKDELYDAGWGRDYMPNSRALDQHMINLRRKLDPDKSRPVLIETVHGVGYRLVI